MGVCPCVHVCVDASVRVRRERDAYLKYACYGTPSEIRPWTCVCVCGPVVKKLVPREFRAIGENELRAPITARA